MVVLLTGLLEMVPMVLAVEEELVLRKETGMVVLGLLAEMEELVAVVDLLLEVAAVWAVLE
jgi:hypothetical protein